MTSPIENARRQPSADASEHDVTNDSAPLTTTPVQYAIRYARMGWPVLTIEIPAPTAERPDRFIAKYVLPDWVRQQVGTLLTEGRGAP